MAVLLLLLMFPQYLVDDAPGDLKCGGDADDLDLAQALDGQEFLKGLVRHALEGAEAVQDLLGDLFRRAALDARADEDGEELGVGEALGAQFPEFAAGVVPGEAIALVLGGCFFHRFTRLPGPL